MHPGGIEGVFQDEIENALLRAFLAGLAAGLAIGFLRRRRT